MSEQDWEKTVLKDHEIIKAKKDWEWGRSVLPLEEFTLRIQAKTSYLAGAASRDGEIERAKQEGRKEVVDWIQMTELHYPAENIHLVITGTTLQAWQAQLKEWGLEV
jgi:hypothetical protein